MTNRRDTDPALQENLARLQAAITASGHPSRALRRKLRRDERQARRGSSPYAGLTVGMALLVAAVATSNKGMLIGGLIVSFFSAWKLLRQLLDRRPDPTRPFVGMGAMVEDGAIVEPGAVVEMGATVRAGAVIKKGAIVRMGATIAAGAILEEHAIVGWGADVGASAVIGAGAVLGSGSTVNAGAQVPAGLRLRPGSTWAKSAQGGPGLSLPVASAPVPQIDPRQARLEQVCARIAAELEQVPASFREHLGATGQTASVLRETCLTLLEREQRLRVESSAERLGFLDQEQAELSARVAQATDGRVKSSLQSALAAIEDQRTQRLALRTSADRLEAEITRLQWTLDGMATQLVRLRTAGTDSARTPDQEVLATVSQLNKEIDAIAEALEEASRHDRAPFDPIGEIEAPPAGEGRRGERVR